MRLEIVLTESDLKQLVRNRLEEMLNKDIEEKDIKIEVKSKQNYKAEWESADFKATYLKNS